MRTARNPYLERIASLLGESDSTRALRVFVETQRAGSESLDSLARKLGVSRIIEQRLPFEGGLFRLQHGELVIKLNSEGSFVRKRFTLAHEIGHLLLETVPAFRSSNKTDAALERTCDLIAAELLMPAVETTNLVRQLGSPCPEKLKGIASTFAVSLQTAAIRVRDGLKLWKCSIGMWEISPKVRTLWFTGLRKWKFIQPSENCLELAIASTSTVRTGDLWQEGPFTERIWLDLLGMGRNRVLGLVNSVD